MIYFVLIYLIMGVYFVYMHSGIIRWVVQNNNRNVNKKFLLIISYIYMTLTFPIRIYGILKKNIEIFENNQKQKENRKDMFK